MGLPTELRINAFTGTLAPGSPVHPKLGHWAGRDIDRREENLRPGPKPDLGNWRHPSVGWGLVLPENTDLSPPERATAIDAPAPIQDLVAERGHAPVLRYSSESLKLTLRRYYDDGTCNEPALSEARGTAKDRIPQYLLLYGAPTVLPWELQYRLNAYAFVGRLDLEGAALANYVTALLTDWDGSASCVDRAVVWAVDHGAPDITHLMRRAIARKVHAELSGDDDIGAGATYIDGHVAPATHERLLAALEANKPGLVVTTSHGMTGPLDDLAQMRSQLGLPVDAERRVLAPSDLLDRWSPDGAIWYAHACCSAGADAETSYAGLVADGSHIARVLEGVARVGAMTAPMPRALLGATRPLRAFVGQVEPTFDWTLRQKETGQMLTHNLVQALYTNLYQPHPVGWAFEDCHRQGTNLDSLHLEAKRAFNDEGADTFGEVLAYRLMAVDWRSMVLLGDPTVMLPPLS